MDTITLVAELRQIKTMADQTVNVTLNLPEYQVGAAKSLMDWLGDEVEVTVRRVSQNVRD